MNFLYAGAGIGEIMMFAIAIVGFCLIIAIFNINTNIKLMNQKMSKILEWMEYFGKVYKTNNKSENTEKLQ